MVLWGGGVGDFGMSLFLSCLWFYTVYPLFLYHIESLLVMSSFCGGQSCRHVGAQHSCYCDVILWGTNQLMVSLSVLFYIPPIHRVQN